MAYVEVPDTDLDADSPVLATVMLQLNDNIKSNKATEVTNGNTHDHVGGDGADLIPSVSLVMTIQSEGSQAIANAGVWTPSAGVYNILSVTSGATRVELEIQVASTWRATVGGFFGGTLFCDGTNMRISNNSGASRTVYYQKF